MIVAMLAVVGTEDVMVSDKRKTGLTVAFSHVLFNIAGTIVWYPVPLMRAVPLSMAKMLGNIAADLPWFPIFYIFFTFGGLPVILLGLSAISPWLCIFVGLPFVIAILSLVALIGLRENKPHLLPAALKKDPSWLINSLRVEKVPEDSMIGTRSGGSVASADLGKGNWHLLFLSDGTTPRRNLDVMQEAAAEVAAALAKKAMKVVSVNAKAMKAMKAMKVVSVNAKAMKAMKVVSVNAKAMMAMKAMKVVSVNAKAMKVVKANRRGCGPGQDDADPARRERPLRGLRAD